MGRPHGERMPENPTITVPRARVERLLAELGRAIGDSRIVTDGDVLESYAEDESDIPGAVPRGVVLADSATAIARTLELAQKLGVPVTPRGAGTGRSGGATCNHEGIVLAPAGLRSIVDIDDKNGIVVAEPFVTTRELHEAVEAAGWFYPPDPNSLESCSIGGNVAENASGPRSYKYGPTRDYVIGIDTVLMGGTTLECGRKTRKGVTGYDVVGLLVGSEGTLGVFTRIRAKLVRQPPELRTLLALAEDDGAAAQAVLEAVALPEAARCIEMLDSNALQALRVGGVAVDARARALVIVELDGEGTALDDRMTGLGERWQRIAGIVDVQLAQDAAQRARLWSARRELSRLVRAQARHKLSEDVVVPAARVPDLLARVESIRERHAVRMLTYGHAGDGNMHVNFLWDNDDERARVEVGVVELMRATIELGGTLTGEHGIGLTKAPYLAIEQSAELIALERSIKRTFDPNELLNPGKIFGGGGHHGAC